MSKLVYLECPTGIAGDMCLGALVDAGVPLEYLTTALGKLGIADEYQLRVEVVHRNGQQATKMHVDLLASQRSTEQATDFAAADGAEHHFTHHHSHSVTEISDSKNPEGHHHHSHSHSHSHHHNHSSTSKTTNRNFEHDSASPTRHLPEIERLIQAAGLPVRAEAWSLAVFRRLAEAEGAVHGIAPEQVHFHEVGATDAIVDIVGTCLGLDWLGIDQIYCSPLPTGGGTVWAAHGRLPVPAPAVLKLWEMRQIPVYSNGIERELVTPTGAAITTTLATQFGAPPPMQLLRIGLGAGSIDLPIPNMLRLWVGERMAEEGREKRKREDGEELKTYPPEEAIAVLETQIDDLNPQAIGYVYEVLFGAGALDVFTQAIAMKKSRPGILLTVICYPEAVAACEAVMFRETTTLGIRRSLQQRSALHREIQSVSTKYGSIRVKVARANLSDPHPINIQPEYEDCAQIAQQHNLPWREVHQLALEHWYGEWGVGNGE